jgi:hypothetical protein
MTRMLGRFRGTALTVAGYRADWKRQETQGKRAQRQFAYAYSKIHCSSPAEFCRMGPSADGKICYKRQCLELRPKPAQNNWLDRTELSIPIIAVHISESFIGLLFHYGRKTMGTVNSDSRMSKSSRLRFVILSCKARALEGPPFFRLADCSPRPHLRSATGQAAQRTSRKPCWKDYSHL